jgi:hypothetical protein
MSQLVIINETLTRHLQEADVISKKSYSSTNDQMEAYKEWKSKSEQECGELFQELGPDCEWFSLICDMTENKIKAKKNAETLEKVKSFDPAIKEFAITMLEVCKLSEWISKGENSEGTLYWLETLKNNL